MNSKKMRRGLAAFGVIALGASLPALADTHPSYSGETTVTVDQSKFGTSPVPTADWNQTYDQNRSQGVAELVAGPRTPALGSGSLRLTTGNSNDLTQVAASGFSHLKLSAFEGVKYSTYVDEDSQDGPVQAAFKIAMSDTTLVYEPYMAYGNGPASVQGAWQTWDAVNGGNGKGWWATRNFPACGQATPCTFEQIKAAVGADRTITDIRVGVGSGIANFDGNVDDIDLTISGWRTRFNFESNKVNADVVTRVDESRADGWSFEGRDGTGATNAADNAWSGSYVAGPDFAGQSGAGSAQLKHGGSGAYSNLVQNYAEGRGDLTQTYLGSLDNIYYQSYRLAESTKSDFPTMKFEVRLPDPQTQFAFTSIVNTPSGLTAGSLAKVDAIHGASTADARHWQLTNAIAGLQAWTPYTWAELMRTELRDAVIMKAMVGAGSSSGTGVFTGGVDMLRFEYRDGSSKTWDFEKSGVNPAPTTTTTVATTTPPPPSGDQGVPTVKITTANLTRFVGQEVEIKGTATDDYSGLDKIGVEFVGALGVTRAGYFGDCTGCAPATGPSSATWTVKPTAPLLPGVYTATAYAHDHSGKVGQSAPITIVVVG